jgi:uncharacterized membrane protein
MSRETMYEVMAALLVGILTSLAFYLIFANSDNTLTVDGVECALVSALVFHLGRIWERHKR